MTEPKTTDWNENSEFLYEFTGRSLGKVYESIDSTTTKLTATLGISGVLLRFAADIRGDYAFTFKFIIVASLFFSIGYCAIGLIPENFGDAIRPEEFLETEWYRETKEECRVHVARKWIETTIPETKKILNKRLGYLKSAIKCLIFGTLIYGASIVLSGIN